MIGQCIPISDDSLIKISLSNSEIEMISLDLHIRGLADPKGQVNKRPNGTLTKLLVIVNIMIISIHLLRYCRLGRFEAFNLPLYDK